MSITFSRIDTPGQGPAQNDVVSTGTLRGLASLDPVKSLATLPDDQLAAMARHLLPDMAGELLAYRLWDRAQAAEHSKNSRLLIPAWMRAGRSSQTSQPSRTAKSGV